jgi:MFS family permease
MYRLNVKDTEIGILLSITLFLQLFTALAGGVLTDKIGRRRITFFTDIVAWSVPCLIWAFSQNFAWFLVAAVFNSLDQVSHVSWQCLLVEDTEADLIVPIYNWVYISGLLAVFFAPFSSILVGRFSLVPVMRGLLIFTFISMTFKFIILYKFSTETKQGNIRMAETRGIPFRRMFWGYRAVIVQILRTPETLRVLLLSVLSGICLMVTGNFFSLYATENLSIPESYLAWFPMVRAAVMLLFFFGAQQKFARGSVKTLMLSGLGLYAAGHGLLIALNPSAAVLPLLVLYTVLDACAAALFLPRRDAMIIHGVDPTERARTMSVIQMMTLGVSSPFGYIAGRLSALDRRLPFVLNFALFLAMIVISAWGRDKTWQSRN